MRTLTTLLLSTCFLLPCSYRDAAGQNLSIESRNGSQKITLNHRGISSFNIETRGKMELTDDDKDVKSMSSDGYLEINKTVFGNRRTLIVTPQGNGLKREYYEGRTLVAFEPEGRKWMNEVMPELVRSTTIGAESRVVRFYRKGGTKAVLDEIRIIESDYVKVRYANLLMEQNVTASDYASIVAQVSESIDSDHYITEFLTRNMDKLILSKEATEAIFAATRNMDSDHYKTEVIKEALRSGPASLESVKIALQATGNMSSDHYKTEVLTSLLRQNNLTDAIIAEMINTTKTMDSDHYRTVVLNKALAKQGLSSASFQQVLESVKDMDSDFYKSEVLTNLLQNALTPEAHLYLMNILTSIDSEHYSTLIGKQILQKQTLNEEAFQKLLDIIGGHKSDYYFSEFLRSAADRPSMSKQNMLTIIKATGNIQSDHYITEVLTKIAPWIKTSNDANLKEAYRVAAKKIESETYYGRAMRAID